MSDEWKKQSERSNTFTLKLIAWIALHTGRRITRLFLYPIVLYFYIAAPTARKASFYYLSRVFGRPARQIEIARHIYWFAATILDRVYFLTDQLDKLEIKINNFDVVEKYKNDKQGVMLLGSHFGSFEAMRSLAQTGAEIPLKILMYQNHNQMITRILAELNPQVAASVIDLSQMDALIKMHEAIEAGYMIGMLGDRVTENDKIIPCQLLGSEANFPAGPMLVASIIKKPVILFYCLYMGKNRYEIYFEELAERIDVPRSDRESKIAYWTQLYVEKLEFYIKKSPYNWFNFYNFWHD